MSSPKPKTLGRIAVAVGIVLGLTACFRPLYGPTAAGGTVQSHLAAIEVAEINTSNDRLSHYLRSELVFDLDGSGQPEPKRYKLAISFTERRQSAIVDTETGRAESATLTGNASYRLTALDGGTLVTSGTATGYATYDRSPQRFATVRAGRDAEIRLAKVLSEQIRTRLAAAFASGR